MDVRLFSDGRAYVTNQILEVEHVVPGTDASQFIIPLSRDQVDMNTLQIPGTSLSSRAISIVTKGNDSYMGTLVDITDNRATLIINNRRVIIRDYDDIIESQYISGIGNIGNKISVSYLTTGIVGTIIHRLNLDTRILSTILNVRNNTPTDIVNAQFEVVTSSQIQQPMMYARTMVASNAIIQQSSTGSIYIVDGRYSVKAGFEISIPLIESQIDIDRYYIIDAPNGVSDAQYTIDWISPEDLPSGELFVYHSGQLEGNIHINSIGKDQVVSTSLLNIPSVYARGTISRQRKSDTESTVTLNGIIYNSLDEAASVVLRYFVGDSTTSIDSNRDGQYIVFPMDINTNGSAPYNISFTMSM